MPAVGSELGGYCEDRPAAHAQKKPSVPHLTAGRKQTSRRKSPYLCTPTSALLESDCCAPPSRRNTAAVSSPRSAPGQHQPPSTSPATLTFTSTSFLHRLAISLKQDLRLEQQKRTMAEQAEIFNDSVHGHIKMHPLLVKIIDTPEFQRLKNIKQLGAGYFVFPGASHNRFEHSIGVAHLAGELVRSLRAQGNDITDKDELCVQIAGLCHDLGHGPFSHVFEIFMKEAKQELKWEHEAASVRMFEQLIKNKKNNKTIEKIMEDDYKFDKNDIEFIKELIDSKAVPHSAEDTWPYEGRGRDKSYLYEIVANKRTGIDVDKMDYFSRDCLHLGMKSNFSHERYVMFARVCTNEKNEKQICIRDKEALNMYELFHVRYLLHHTAYQHRVKVAIEMMIVDALLAAEADFMLDGMKISAVPNEPKKYLKITDDILQEIKHSEQAKDIIERIEKRDLYSCVGSKIFQPEALEDLNTAEQQEPELSEKDFRVRPIKIDYGKKEENPIDSLRFYSKDEKDKAVPLSAYEVSYIQPGIFYETKVMLFYKKKPVPDLSKEDINLFWKMIRKLPEQKHGAPHSKRPRRQ
ncbi:deoxynucleoside triphosphate triphosphohydrolase SAMHD1-like [Pangasianodon hypophthalmus]|uniref:deoxynucleoside triphosphate triphosphohydrolase SAMHD1-like n=1 Tax=Pangasianodon hypophthalmus TaxID=310915 RepID=UPI002306FFB5|nr:deoxynucleoside triphosphate triphosphohydrolase SAMHD1-like [Pangasianodon hypophthalmus]